MSVGELYFPFLSSKMVPAHLFLQIISFVLARREKKWGFEHEASLSPDLNCRLSRLELSHPDFTCRGPNSPSLSTSAFLQLPALGSSGLLSRGPAGPPSELSASLK